MRARFVVGVIEAGHSTLDLSLSLCVYSQPSIPSPPSFPFVHYSPIPLIRTTCFEQRGQKTKGDAVRESGARAAPFLRPSTSFLSSPSFRFLNHLWLAISLSTSNNRCDHSYTRTCSTISRTLASQTPCVGKLDWMIMNERLGGYKSSGGSY